MATVVVSGRVDLLTARLAARKIADAGTTPGEVIRITWENIANTDIVPVEHTSALASKQAEALRHLDELTEELGDNELLASMTDEQMNDFIAEGLVEKYGAA